MHAQPVATSVGSAVEMASDVRRDRDRVVDVASVGLFGGGIQGADTDGPVPLNLAGKGPASNIQNELGPGIRAEDGGFRTPPDLRGGALALTAPVACGGSSPR